MKGTFLNFFECKLSKEVMQAYCIDYINKEHFDALREKYPDIFFYRFEGSKIYYWKRRKNAIIPVELKGTCIHLKLIDYPQVFKAIVTSSVAELFKNNGAVVHKNKHSSTFEIESNNNATKDIDGLEVKRLLLLDSYYSKESKMFGLTLAFRTKNIFNWTSKEFSQNGIAIEDLSKDNDKIYCNKKALTRFLECTNNAQQYKNIVWKMNSFNEQYKTIISTYSYIKKHLSDIYIGDDVYISDISFNNLPYRENAFNMDFLPIPNHYYYLDKTQKGKYNEALKELKPYTYEFFSTDKIKCAVICPRKYEGTEENFAVKLQKKLKEIFFVDIEYSKYYIDNLNVDDYKKSVYDNIINKQDKPDIVIVILEENHKKLGVKQSPYYYCKAKLIGQGIPSQEILIERIKDINEFILNNISLNIYAKIGGTAWTIEKIERAKQEYIIGISSCYDKSKNKIFGVSQIFEYNGNYVVTDCTPLTDMREYEEAFEKYLENTLKSALF